MGLEQQLKIKEEHKLAVNSLLYYAIKKRIPINRTKLQKLLYLWHWECLHAKPASPSPFADIKDPFRAWHYGPVVTELMYYFTRNNVGPFINKGGEVKIYSTNGKNEEMMRNLFYVLDEYGNSSALELTNIAHDKDSPYDETIKKSGRYEKIKDDDIKKSPPPSLW